MFLTWFKNVGGNGNLDLFRKTYVSSGLQTSRILRKKDTEGFRKYASHKNDEKSIVTEHVHEDSDVSFRKRGKMDARKGIFTLLWFIAHRNYISGNFPHLFYIIFHFSEK